MYRHILYAVNTQEHSRSALQKAYQLAQQNGARLTLLHVVDFIPSDGADPMGASIPTTLPQTLVAAEEQKLKEIIEASPPPEDIQLHTQVTLGSARHEIVTQAVERACDLIVIGHHKHRGLGHLLGHTDESVLHHTPCDVLAINLSDA